MKKLLIATFLVLSCSTASADEFYIRWQDEWMIKPTTRLVNGKVIKIYDRPEFKRLFESKLKSKLRLKNHSIVNEWQHGVRQVVLAMYFAIDGTLINVTCAFTDWQGKIDRIYFCSPKRGNSEATINGIVRLIDRD